MQIGPSTVGPCCAARRAAPRLRAIRLRTYRLFCAGLLLAAGPAAADCVPRRPPERREPQPREPRDVSGSPSGSTSTADAFGVRGPGDAAAARSGAAAHELDIAPTLGPKATDSDNFSPLRFHVCEEDLEAVSVMEEVTPGMLYPTCSVAVNGANPNERAPRSSALRWSQHTPSVGFLGHVCVVRYRASSPSSINS